MKALVPKILSLISVEADQCGLVQVPALTTTTDCREAYILDVLRLPTVPLEDQIVSWFSSVQGYFLRPSPHMLADGFSRLDIPSGDLASKVLPVLERFYDEIDAIPKAKWNIETLLPIGKRVAGTIQHDETWAKRIWAFLRWALFGVERGHELRLALAVLGKDEVVLRLRAAKECLESRGKEGGR